MKFNAVLIFSLLCLASGIETSSAQEYKDSVSVLLVGNSYIYYENLPQLITLISEDTPVKINTKKSVIGGASLKQHWLGERDLKTKEIIKEGNFDIVVIQEQSLGAVNMPDTMMKYANLFCEFIKEQGARPYLYNTWARKKVPQYQETIDEIYGNIAEKNEAVRVPVGEYWEKALEIRPDIDLYSIDGSHPNRLGAFLTACVFVKTISGVLPDKIPSVSWTEDRHGESVFLMRIEPLDVVFCKKLIEEVYQIHDVQ